jgi:hypothetical protein
MGLPQHGLVFSGPHDNARPCPTVKARMDDPQPNPPRHASSPPAQEPPVKPATPRPSQANVSQLTLTIVNHALASPCLHSSLQLWPRQLGMLDEPPPKAHTSLLTPPHQAASLPLLLLVLELAGRGLGGVQSGLPGIRLRRPRPRPVPAGRPAAPGPALSCRRRRGACPRAASPPPRAAEPCTQAPAGKPRWPDTGCAP